MLCPLQRIGGLVFPPNNVGTLFVAQMPLGGQRHQLCDNAAPTTSFAHFVAGSESAQSRIGAFLRLAIQLNPT